MKQAFYGWKLLGVFWLILMVSASIPLYGGGVVNAYMAADLGIDRATLSLPTSVLQFVFGLGAIVSAAIITRFGVRITLTLGGVFMLVGAIAMATFVSNGLQATIVFGGIIGAAFAAGGGIATQVGVSRWFLRRRALAFAILFSAPGIGGFIVAPAMNRFLVATGGDWRLAWWCVAGIGVLLALFAYVFVKEDPAELGQAQDGLADPQLAAVGDPVAQPRKLRAFISTDSWTAPDVYRNWVYWLLVFSGLGLSAGFTLFFAVGMVHLQDLGHTATAASWALGSIGISALIAKAILGVLGDRIDPRFIWAGMIAAGGISLGLVAVADNETALRFFPIFLGAGFGGHMACMMAVMSNYFGQKAFPAIVGIAVAVTTCVGAVPPMFAGAFYGLTGSYSSAFGFMAVWCLAGTVALILVPRPVKRIAAPA